MVLREEEPHWRDRAVSDPETPAAILPKRPLRTGIAVVASQLADCTSPA